MARTVVEFAFILRGGGVADELFDLRDLASGSSERTSATAPATCGAAIEVPAFQP